MTLPAAAPERTAIDLDANRPLDDRYFERMAASLGDKARVIPFLVGRRVLDVGAGGGELARAIAGAGFAVTALDASDEAIRRLESLGGVEVAHGDASDAARVVGGGFDAIVCSAVLHEVYSYAPADARRGTLDAALAMFADMLAPGGRLVIRDGVMPDDPSRPASVLLPPGRIDAFDRYAVLTPHAELVLARDGARVEGTRHQIAELLFTLTWGAETFAREAQERYQLHTLAGYAEAVAPYGLSLVHADAVTQPGYVAALADIEVRDEHGRPWFPPTNGLWVFEHP
ncbi:methyltransferase domain-containing protein [Agromyces protaetiae]|uniref:Methyltransferase domain-containing protein n=1 Tax=Agromyces protaetiae TaxID=2509455 RepID=A0A4P6FDW1_9MICO|nr:methyltransferase domain-containing protein [Agromyces protaetiae]QAY74114.1 methyltransferase domain-containing protein [Agromyces protaetiae]